MSLFRVYLDGIQLVDEPIGLRDLEIEIIREDGFDGSEQILRDKTSTELEFAGDGYAYLCEKKRNNFCGSVSIDIQFLCTSEYQTIFNGIIPVSKVAFNLTKKIAKTEIRDSSFTGKIKDLSKTQIATYISRTRNCEELETVDKNILFGATNVKSFDVLDLFKYLVSFITDNQITVVSDYLIANPIAITTGYNLHNSTGSLSQQFPTITFDALFEQVRKKTRIYLGIEYDSFGVPYLRIEDEPYFYTYTNMLTFNEVPFNTVESIDMSRIFNSITIGSQDTELQDSDTGFDVGYVPNPYTPESYIEQTYTSCGECTNFANSEQNRLDLVSEYIIDTDIIYEALNADATTSALRYANDEKIFMFQYTATPDTANYTLDVVTGVYIYNAGFRNTEVIANWFGYTPQCITLRNSTENYFLVERGYAQEPVQGGQGSGCVQNNDGYLSNVLYYNNPFATATVELIDNGNNVNGFVFTAPTDGNYVFKQSTNVKYLYGTFPLINDTDPTYTPIFAVIDESNVLVEIVYGNSYTTTSINEYVSTEFISPILTLSVGWTVSAGLAICQNGTVDANFDYYELTNTKWELLRDTAGCETTQDETDSKPVLLEFRSSLCCEDLIAIRNDKRGTIVIDNKDFWIKSIKWKQNELSEFILIGNDSFCKC